MWRAKTIYNPLATIFGGKRRDWGEIQRYRWTYEFIESKPWNKWGKARQTTNLLTKDWFLVRSPDELSVHKKAGEW